MKNNNERIYKMEFNSVYTLYIKKVERKGRSKQEVDSIIYWLTGYNEEDILNQIERKVDFETFFSEMPKLNPNANKINGVICGIRIEDIEDDIVKKVRWLDKLVDEIAKGKPLDKIMRS